MSTNKPLWQQYQRGLYGDTPTAPDPVVSDLPTSTSASDEDAEIQNMVNGMLDQEFGDDAKQGKATNLFSDAAFGEPDDPSLLDQLHFGFKEAWYTDEDSLVGTTKDNIEKYLIAEYPRKAARYGVDKATYGADQSLWESIISSNVFKFAPTDEDWHNMAMITGVEGEAKLYEEEYIKKHYGKDWLDITPDERRARMDEESNALLKEQFPDIYGTEYAHSVAAGVGNLGVIAFDPLTYVAPLATSYKKAAAIGASYGAIDVTTKGLADKGYITPSEVAIGTIGGAVLGPALRGAGKGMVKVFDKAMVNTRIRTSSKLLNGYEAQVNKAVKSGADWNEAVMVARMATGMDGPTVQKMYEITGRTFNMENVGGVSNRFQNEIEKKASNSWFYRAINGTGETIAPYITPMTDVLRKHAPRMFQALRAQDAKMHFRMHNSFVRVKPWLEQVSKMSKADQTHMKKLISSGEQGAFKETAALTRKYMLADPENFRGFAKNWKAVQQELRDTAKAYDKVGHDMDILKFYFPRVTRDPNAFDKVRIGWLATQVEKAAKKKGSVLSADEIGELFAQATSRHIKKARRTPVSGNLRKRMEPELTDYLEPHYADPAQALHSYFRTAARDIERASFFNKFMAKGHKYKLDGSDLDKVINKMSKHKGAGVVNELAGMDPIRREKTAELLRARFGAGEQSPKSWIQQYKNVGYTVLLGNPLSALTQLGDQGFALYKNGIRHYIKALTSTKVIEKTDIGLTEAMEELFANTTTTKRFLDWSLKWSGFNGLDKFGKDMILNSAFRKYVHWAKNPKGLEKIRKQWGRYFEGDIEDLIKGLKKGDVKNENVRLLLWHELSDVQPIALSEMPQKYLESPNGRIFYMLKTFTIKQLAFMKREIFEEFGKGNTATGTRKLIAFTGIWLAANGGADKLKAMMKGEEFDVADNTVENLAQMTGISKYTMESGMRDGPVSAAMDFVLPPVPIVDDVAKAIASQDATKALKAIPMVGNLVYQRIKNEQKKTAKRRKSTW